MAKSAAAHPRGISYRLVARPGGTRHRRAAATSNNGRWWRTSPAPAATRRRTWWPSHATTTRSVRSSTATSPSRSSLNSKTPFDLEKDFAPVGRPARRRWCRHRVRPGGGQHAGRTAPVGIATGAEAKYGTPGNGTVGHLGMELLKMRTSIRATHVPSAPQPAGDRRDAEERGADRPCRRPWRWRRLAPASLAAIGVTRPTRSLLAERTACCCARPTCAGADLGDSDRARGPGHDAGTGSGQVSTQRLDQVLRAL